MNRIIIMLCLLNSFFAISMDDPKNERRKSCSLNGTTTLVAKHKRQSSFSDKIRISLHLKTDEIKNSSSTLDALVTGRRAPEQPVQSAFSKMGIDRPVKTDSRNLIGRAGENNRNNFTKMIMFAYEAIKNMEAVDDDAYKQYKSNIKYARHYYISWISLDPTNNAWVTTMADDELKPVQEAFDKKLASFVNAQKK